MTQMIRNTQQETNMNVNITPPPASSKADELVPSRYALRIGEIDVLVVSDGVLTLPGAMLAHNAEPAVRAAWLNDNFLPPDAFARPYSSTLGWGRSSPCRGPGS